MITTTRGLIATDATDVQLVGASCGACGTHTFPFQSSCPKCAGSMEQAALPATGTVWSWTVQRVRPKLPYLGPDQWEPFAVGYVDLGPLKVECRLEGRDPEAWEIGAPVRFEPGEPDADGEVWRYRFVATGSSESFEVTS
jgi:uncharacterized OB-fold protein